MRTLQVLVDEVHRVVVSELCPPTVLDHARELVLEDLAARAARAHLLRVDGDLLRVAVPAPVDARLGAVGVPDDLVRGRGRARVRVRVRVPVPVPVRVRVRVRVLVRVGRE